MVAKPYPFLQDNWLRLGQYKYLLLQFYHTQSPVSASIRLCSLNKTNKTKKSALPNTLNDPYGHTMTAHTEHIKKNKISFPPAGTSGISTSGCLR